MRDESKFTNAFIPTGRQSVRSDDTNRDELRRRRSTEEERRGELNNKVDDLR